MRIVLPLRRREQGSILMVSLWTMLIIGIALLTYLRLATNQNQLVVHSQVWNQAIAVTEAGIEEALSHIAVNYSTNMVSNGWSLSSTNTYYRTNSVGEGWFSVSITTNKPYTIISSGNYPLAGTGGTVTRSVKVTTFESSTFKYAMMVRDGISMNGNGCLIDSYDSSDPTKSTLGQYDPAKASDKAIVVLHTGKTGVADTGNGNIWGKVIVGPGGTAKTGANGAIGDKNWNLTKSGVQPGSFRTDNNSAISDVAAPFLAGIPPNTGVTNSGIVYNQVFDNGNFMAATLTGKSLVTGNATVYITGNINASLITIQTNAFLRLYCGGASAVLNNVDNKSKLATHLTYYGLPANTSLDFDADWVGVIYAPNTTFSIAGSTDIMGSITVKGASLKGNAAFHYDEALGKTSNSLNFAISTWTEF